MTTTKVSVACLLFSTLALPLPAFELVIVTAEDDTKYRTLKARIVRIAPDSSLPTSHSSPIQAKAPSFAKTLRPGEGVRWVRVVVHGSKDMEKAWEPLLWYVAPLGQPMRVTVPHLYSSAGFYRARAEWWTPNDLRKGTKP